MSNDYILFTDVFKFFWKKKYFFIFINIIIISTLYLINNIKDESFYSSYIVSQAEKKDLISVILYNNKINSIYKDAGVENIINNIDEKQIIDEFYLIANLETTKKNFYFNNKKYKQYIDKKGNIKNNINSSIEFNKSDNKLTFKSSDDNAEYYLSSYVVFVNNIVNRKVSEYFNKKIELLESGLSVKIKKINFDIHSKIESEIYQVKTNLKIATQAGISNPLVNYNNNDLFNIAAGSKILSAKLQSLYDIKKSDYIYLSDKLENLNNIIINKKELNEENIVFKSYKLKEITINPLSNKLSTIFIILFGLLLGGIISLLYAINCVSKSRCIE